MAVNLELEIIEGASIEVINSKTIESKTQHKYTMESTNFINPRAFSSVLTALVSYSLGPIKFVDSMVYAYKLLCTYVHIYEIFCTNSSTNDSSYSTTKL